MLILQKRRDPQHEAMHQAKQSVRLICVFACISFFWIKSEKVVHFVNFDLSHIRAFVYMGSNMTSLVHVNFESCMISDDGLLAIAKGCPYLQSIDISWCKMLSSAGLVQFAGLSAGVKHLSCRFLSNVNRKYYNINTIGMSFDSRH